MDYTPWKSGGDFGDLGQENYLKTLTDSLNDAIRTIYTNSPLHVGQSDSSICAQYTTVPATFWENHADACQDLITRRAHSILVGIVVSAVIVRVFSILAFSRIC